MIIFLSFILSFVTQAFAHDIDLSVGAQGRSAPGIGAELFAETGYNQLLWGKKDNQKDILYGLIRPSLGVSTSAVINSAKMELEVYPISILGFSVGRQYIHSNYDFPFFQCKEISCEGNFQRNWFETKMVLGAAGWVAVGHYKVDKLDGHDAHLPVADWRNVIVGQPGGDVQIDKKLILGKMFGQNMAGVLLESTRFEGSKERRESFAAIYQFKHDQTQYVLGAGALHTNQQPMGFILYFRINHTLLPSKKLF